MSELSISKTFSYALLPGKIEAYQTQVEMQNPDHPKFDASKLNQARICFYGSLALSLTILGGNVFYGKNLNPVLRNAISTVALGIAGTAVGHLFLQAKKFYQHFNNQTVAMAPSSFVGSDHVVDRPAVTEAQKEMAALLTDDAIEKAPSAEQATMKCREREVGSTVISPSRYV